MSLAIIITVLNNFLSVFINPLIINGVLSAENHISLNTMEMSIKSCYGCGCAHYYCSNNKIHLKDKMKYINKIRKPIAKSGGFDVCGYRMLPQQLLNCQAIIA